MLNLKTVENITFDRIQNQLFDLAIFASGYESRCVHLASHIDLNKVSIKLAFGFAEHSEIESRQANDRFYKENSIEPITVSSQDEKALFDKLVSTFEILKDKTEINLLIDYTSMSRLWYSGILNFLRLQNKNSVNVYLNYSLGEYTNNFLDYSYTSINSLPSHEGSLSSNNKTLLVLAIGFSPYMVKSVIEEIEPNEIIGILPIPNIKPKYEQISEEIKNDILTQDIENWIRCPINDLESIFRTYAELTSSNIHRKDLIFLSLGPKIFTLASILVSQRFDQVTCLYLKSSSGSNGDVKATGDFICNKITYV
jgi:hypothetical protein